MKGGFKALKRGVSCDTKSHKLLCYKALCLKNTEYVPTHPYVSMLPLR